MYDLIGHIIIVKVSSHQLDSNMELENSRRKPWPNLFVMSANQIADNAATQAHGIYELQASMESDICFYPPFSPRWSFSFDGALTNKGATKVLYQKNDEELSLWQQHRPKQGVFLRMINQNFICAEQIGEETLRSIMKMTAPCWTRCIYRYPPLAHQVWINWKKLRKDENEVYTDELPSDLPKNWRKYPNICNDIVMACPFCTYTYSENIRKGNLEHLHYIAHRNT
jgi:hypothetical protein